MIIYNECTAATRSQQQECQIVHHTTNIYTEPSPWPEFCDWSSKESSLCVDLPAGERPLGVEEVCHTSRVPMLGSMSTESSRKGSGRSSMLGISSSDGSGMSKSGTLMFEMSSRPATSLASNKSTSTMQSTTTL